MNNPLLDQLKSDKVTNILLNQSLGLEINSEINSDRLHRSNSKSAELNRIEDKVNVIEYKDNDIENNFKSNNYDTIEEFLAKEDELNEGSKIQYDFENIQSAFYKLAVNLIKQNKIVEKDIKLSPTQILNARSNGSEKLYDRMNKLLILLMLLSIQLVLFILSLTTSIIKSKTFNAFRLRSCTQILFFAVFPSIQLSFYTIIFYFLSRKRGVAANIYDIECYLKAKSMLRYFDTRFLFSIFINFQFPYLVKDLAECSSALVLLFILLFPIGFFIFIFMTTGLTALFSSLCSLLTIPFLLDICEDILCRILKIKMIQEKLLVSVETQKLNLEVYFKSIDEISKIQSSVKLITFFTLLTAVINGIGAFFYILMMVGAPYYSFLFLIGLGIVGLLIFVKEILLFFYLTYEGSKINDLHRLILFKLSKKRWIEDSERLSICFAASTFPVYYEVYIPNYISWFISVIYNFFSVVISSFLKCHPVAINYPELYYLQITISKQTFYTTLVGYLVSGLISVPSLYAKYSNSIQHALFE